jgi:surface antigen
VTLFRTLLCAALAFSARPSLAIDTGYLQCVPYARQTSGIQIYGDARTWWDQADGRYKRGNRPRIGAVLAFKPHGAMVLGHVATVSAIIDERTIRVSHANWSPINGVRGQIEQDVDVIDVSEAGDWSAVRVWFAPIQNLGSTAWPTHGFIYSGKPAGAVRDAAPTLHYASVVAIDQKFPSARPTGRLSYLGQLLPKLKDKSAKAL